MNKKILFVLFSVSLLIICENLLAYENISSSGDIIYVDDDNTMGPWDGTQEHPYQYIQDGIDNASPGDTVFVFNGTYYENVLVDKSITLLGENKYITIIDGEERDHVVTITADLVNVSGFTIQYGGNEEQGSGVYARTNNSRISENIIVNNSGNGIYLVCSYNNDVVSNVIYENIENGIYLEDSFDNAIFQNTLTTNKRGIYLLFSENNNLSQNMIFDISVGVQLDGSPDTNISWNTITRINFGVELIYSPNCVIVRNKISDYQNFGIFIAGYSHNTNVSGNNVTNGGTGIRLMDSSLNVIIGNMLVNNTEGCYVKTSNNVFYHNVFIGNDKNAWDNSDNTWDNGYPSGGNYWDDYSGKDEFSGPNQTEPGSDGIGDIPYDIPGGDNQDRYPLGFFDEESPTITIAKPKQRFLYVINYEIMPFFITLILVNIDIEVNASDNNSGIDWVEIYIDDVLKANISSPPFIWSWEERTPLIFRHSIRAVANDKTGNSASDELKVWKVF